MTKTLIIFVVALLLSFNLSLFAQQSDTSFVKEKPLPEVINQIKKSLAYVEAKTNVEGVVKQGTGFLITLVDNIGVLATCRHILFEPGEYEGQKVLPDTSRIMVRFHNHKQFVNAYLLADREDRDIALLCVILDTLLSESYALSHITAAKVPETEEGMEAAYTGYDLTQHTKKFGKLYLWPTTHRGIISSLRLIGPEGDVEFLDYIQLDVVSNKGASGSPAYLARSGKVIGIVTGMLAKEVEDVTVGFGITNCQPIWAVFRLLGSEGIKDAIIRQIVIDYMNKRKKSP